VAETVFPSAKVVVVEFHVIANSNTRMDEARRIEEGEHQKKLQILKLTEENGREREEGKYTFRMVPCAVQILLGRGEDKGTPAASKPGENRLSSWITLSSTQNR